MRIVPILSCLAASAALIVAPAALAQTAPDKAQQPRPAAAKPAPKAAEGKATKVEGASTVRATPADAKKSGDKSHDGCGSGKMSAALDA